MRALRLNGNWAAVRNVVKIQAGVDPADAQRESPVLEGVLDALPHLGLIKLIHKRDVRQMNLVARSIEYIDVNTVLEI